MPFPSRSRSICDVKKCSHCGYGVEIQTITAVSRKATKSCTGRVGGERQNSIEVNANGLRHL